MAAWLRARHPGRFVAQYGREARRLGGTTNSQARFLNSTARSLFVHLEMAAAVRAAAARDTEQERWPHGSFSWSLAGLLGVGVRDRRPGAGRP